MQSVPPTDPIPIPISNLAGPHVLRPQHHEDEQRGRAGGCRGCSLSIPIALPRNGAQVRSMTPVGRTLEVAHYATPLHADAGWDDIAAQRIYVWARFADGPADTIAGAMFIHPYVRFDADGTPDLSELHHPGVWFSEQTDILVEDFKGHGIASALYAHLAAFGYSITQSEALQGGDGSGRGRGDALWRRLHPTFDEDLEAGRLPLLSATFTDVMRAQVAARFAPDSNGDDFDLNPILSHRTWGFRSWPYKDTAHA